MNRLVQLLRLAASSALLGLGLLHCSCGVSSALPNSTSDASSPDSGDSGASDAAKDIEGWKEGSVDAWQKIGPNDVEGGLPDCGPGCRIALNSPLHNRQVGHSYSTEWVASDSTDKVLLAKLGGSVTRVPALAGSEEGLVAPQIGGNLLAYTHVTHKPAGGTVELINLENGLSRTLTRYDQDKDHPGDSDFGVGWVAVNSQYAFWMRSLEGLYRANITTGEVELLTKLTFECDRWCVTDKELICGSSLTTKADRIDIETGEYSQIDDGGAMQIDVACSSDRRWVTWVDYRDPPGQNSQYMGYRNGGEVYLHDLKEHKTTRITNDSPGNPKAKYQPATDGETIIWFEPCETCTRNPDNQPDVDFVTTTLVRKKLGEAKTCRLDKAQARGWSSVHGNHLYGYWHSDEKDRRYLVDLDMDYPGLPWKCTE